MVAQTKYHMAVRVSGKRFRLHAEYMIYIHVLYCLSASSWLMGRNCEIAGSHCDWTHCVNQCHTQAGAGLLEDLGDLFHAERGQKGYEILLGDTTPG